ncbi:alpha/beta family hydrolase [Kangiella sp. TOML190]|uniref:alpha/beta family hydrolase n=1 Tax=Kangiella sp. TOML190 TaxID=2931351 RepID=UPI002041ECDB|nr:alpha/beta family hydrolase [Kangiella sp. TOML190]
MKKANFIFAHGAGADSQSEFMTTLAKLIRCQQLNVIRFDFPYMQRRQFTGKKSPPDRMDKLQNAFIEQIETIKADTNGEQIFIGGKSMGGRVATMIADQVSVAGVVCFGYPFHPPGKPEKLRTEHLQTLQTPCLILQGERDTFGKVDEVSTYGLAPSIDVRWFKDANHSLETLKRSEISTEQSWQLAANQAQNFMLEQLNA